MQNQEIRRAIASAKIRYWEVATEYGCTDGTFSRKLRQELPAEEKEKILQIIQKLSKKKERT